MIQYLIPYFEDIGGSISQEEIVKVDGFISDLNELLGDPNNPVFPPVLQFDYFRYD